MSCDITLLFTGLSAKSDRFLFGMSTVALVRAEGRLIMFDTGPYAYRPIMLGRLKGLGISPADVDTVVLSHMHWDSATNADLFTKAEVVVHERELAHAEHPGAQDRETPRYMYRALRKLRLKPIAGDFEFVPGLSVVELPGHTPGSIGLLAGERLLAGDAVACARDAISGTPEECFGNRREAGASIAKALSIAKIICPGHDRPFHVGPPIAYESDYALRIRFFIDPAGEDQEICIKAEKARSFATWP